MYRCDGHSAAPAPPTPSRSTAVMPPLPVPRWCFRPFFFAAFWDRPYEWFADREEFVNAAWKECEHHWYGCSSSFTADEPEMLLMEQLKQDARRREAGEGGARGEAGASDDGSLRPFNVFLHRASSPPWVFSVFWLSSWVGLPRGAFLAR